MIFISKLFTVFLLPPGCVILGLFVLILFVPRRYKAALGIITVFFYLLSIQPVMDALLLPLEDAYPPLPADSSGCEAIIVLGSGTIQNSPEAVSGTDTLSADAVKRAVYAFSLRNTYPVPIVFSGGKVFDYRQEPEAIAAGRLFASLGLPPERFIPETKSRNTWENAKETAKLGFSRVVLVTSAYHIKRSVICFEHNGMLVIPAPTDYKCDRGRKYDFLSFLPSMLFLKYSWQALHEYVGLVYYYLVYRSE